MRVVPVPNPLQSPVIRTAAVESVFDETGVERVEGVGVDI